MHAIKINRALRASKVGAFPGSAAAMIVHLPTSLIESLTGQQLGEMLDALWRVAGASKAIAAREVIADGCVWDDRAGRLRLVA